MDRKWWTLIAVSFGVFMLLLDITVVNVALPDIQRSLHSSFSDVQWVIDAYSLTLAAFLLTSGSLADLFGRRLIFTVGLVIFTCSSALCGLSTSPGMLNFARAVQGVGGAMMFATSLALIANAFRGRDRGTAFGVFGAVNGAAVAVGPVVGGVITSGIGWEWIFFVNVPIGIAAVFVTLTKVVESRDPKAAGVDWAGLVTFSGGLFLLVYALVQGNVKGWGSTEIVAMLAGAAVLLVLFLVVELAQRRPMLDLALFRRPAFTGANIVAFCLAGSYFAMFLYLTLYIQDVLHYSPVEAGLRFLPITLLSFIVAPVAGRLSVRVPVRLLLGSGLVLCGVSLLMMTALTSTSSWTFLTVPFILGGAGIGLVNPPLASTAIGVVPHERSGMASGINATFRQVGIATGIAGLGAIFQHEILTSTTSALRQLSAGGGAAREVIAAGHGQLGQALSSGSLGGLQGSIAAGARTTLTHAYRIGFVDAFTTIAAVAAGIALIGSVAAFVLVRSKDFVTSQQAPSEAPEGEPVMSAAG